MNFLSLAWESQAWQLQGEAVSAQGPCSFQGSTYSQTFSLPTLVSSHSFREKTTQTNNDSKKINFAQPEELHKNKMPGQYFIQVCTSTTPRQNTRLYAGVCGTWDKTKKKKERNKKIARLNQTEGLYGPVIYLSDWRFRCFREGYKKSGMLPLKVHINTLIHPVAVYALWNRINSNK